MKKYMLLCAAAIVAAAACTREPVAPEEPEVLPEGPISVTLVSGSPETKTELGIGSDNKLHPFWSAGDNINLVRIPEPEDLEYLFEYDEDKDDYVYYLFTGDASQRSPYAEFYGSVESTGQYRAFYPERTDVLDEWGYLSKAGPFLNTDYPAFGFNIPTVQYPTSTSFDKSADLLVSAPFTIPGFLHPILGTENSNIPISFTRANAILKVKFNPTGELSDMLANQKVREVSFNSSSSGMNGDGGEPRNAPRTRAYSFDSEDYEAGLTGEAYYIFSYAGDPDSFDVNESDSYAMGYGIDWVFAKYTDDTAYEILSQDAETATYFMVFPSILKNYVDEDDGTFYEGLPIRVETDDYVIRREITLPSIGVALQPSVVTTLNITLSNDNAEIVRKGISFNPSETTLIAGEGEYVDLEATEVYFPKNEIYSEEAFQEFFTVTAPEGISLRYVEYGEVGDYGTDVGYEGDCVRYLYLSVADGVDPGDYAVTVSYQGFSASFTVHVIDINTSSFIEFADPAVEAICATAWGGRREAGKITYYEASKVTSLDNPDTYKSYFQDNTDIVSFGELQYFTGLHEIGYKAFYGCKNLKNVVIPNSVTMIQSADGGNSYAFQDCTSLENVVFPESLVCIGFKAFYGCTSLEEITLPASVQWISPDAFRDCTGLTTVNIPANSQLESIYGDFYSSSSEYGVHGAFYGCISLESIELPPTLKNIGYSAFRDCLNLSSVTIPEGVTSIGGYAFAGCSTLEGITIPGTVSTLSDDVFNGCTSLSEVVLNEGLEIIGRRAFLGCTSLHQIVFPASLLRIGAYSGEGLVFYGVKFYSGTDSEGNVYQGVKFLGSDPPSFGKNDIVISGKHWENGDWVDGVNVYVPAGSVEAYQNLNNITDSDKNTVIGF